MEGIADGAATVHAYQRLASDWGGFLKLFRTGENKIHGWNVTRIGTDERLNTSCGSARYHLFAFRGYMGVDDSAASELAFQQVIENICEAFRRDMDLAGAADPGYDDAYQDIGVVQVETVEPRMFGSVLCHSAELRYRCREIHTDIAV